MLVINTNIGKLKTH